MPAAEPPRRGPMSGSEMPAAELPRRGPGRVPLLLRAAVSLGLLAGLAVWLDAGAVASRLASMRPSWVLAALALSVVQVAVLAWRWSFTARRLGVDLPWPVAWREYYLSIFLNQVLPGGVLGDVARAWRQARSQVRVQAPRGPAVRAVVFERLSAQVVMTTVAGASLLFLPVTVVPGSRPAMVGAALLAGGLVVATIVWMRRQSSEWSLYGPVLAEVGAAHLAPAAFAAQLASALVVVATYLATYLLAARAVGVETPLPVLLPLVAPVLMSMLIPVTVAGWGLREGAAAVLWGAVGLTAADGVLVSVAYGLLVLAGSAPGALFLTLGLRRGRSRPGGPIESAPVGAGPRHEGDAARFAGGAPASPASVYGSARRPTNLAGSLHRSAVQTPGSESVAAHRSTNPAGGQRRSTAQTPSPESVARGSARRPTNPAGGQRRSTAQTPGSAQVEVEQHVVAEREPPARGPQGAVERRDGGQLDGVTAGADDQRGHRDVQAGQDAGFEEP